MVHGNQPTSVDVNGVIAMSWSITVIIEYSLDLVQRNLILIV